MKEFLEKQWVFDATLKALAFLAKRERFDRLTRWVTTQTARLNILMNKPRTSASLQELADTWQQLMPQDGQHFFPIREITEDTAYTEIHLHCPLRGSGDTHACYKLMNYDRKLMEKVGGQLIVLESQSNSGKNYCQLAIRRKDAIVRDLVPAHQK